ncbi:MULTISPECIES: flagellar motor protein [Sulfitobacter]|uniref:flagellar motor protein n=1 Tax=Sulfitobacter TaxID=60136 RepID=UPI0025799BAD|nr:flagellar motor protein [Sulfitobacter sp. UBA1132]
MAGRRQIAALKLINTIRQHELDAIGAQLSGLRAQQTSLTEQSAALTQRAIAEHTGSTLETQAYLPAYLSSVDRQQRGLAAEGDALSGQIDTLEDALFAQFRALKTTQTVLSKAQTEAKADADRAEQAALDDASRALFALQRR